MEIFLLYNFFFTACMLFGMTLSDAHFLGLIIGGGIWLALFILQGFGLWKMAKNRGMKKKGLAFVPFANYLYMSKLAGSCNVFGQKVKNAGLFVMIVQIISTLFCALLIAAISYLLVAVGDPTFVEGVPDWVTSGFAQTVERFYFIGAGYTFGISILTILQLVYDILMLILTIGLYRKYAPKTYSWLALLGILPIGIFSSARYIVIFCLRNREAIDWDAYMRARREELARQYQARYGGGYGTPYGGNPYGNPYGNAYGNGGQNAGQNTPKPEEPFGEFGGEKDEEKTGEHDDGFFR